MFLVYEPSKKHNMRYIEAFLIIASVFAAAQCLLVEADPFIEKLFNSEFIANKGANYSLNYLQKIANETGASIYPKLDNFNDEEIKQQIRKNVLVIIDKFLSLRHDNMSGWQTERVANALAIQNIYRDDATFNNRPLPKYYHTTINKWVKAILTDMKIKYLPALYPGAWVATGFYDWFKLFRMTSYSPVFAFSSVLEIPVNEVSTKSHYIRDAERNNYYGIGRLHDIDLWKNNTDLVQWAVETRVHEDIINFIKTNFTFEKANFLLERLTTIDQMILERDLILIAHAYTNDRANAMIVGSVWPDWPRSQNKTCNFGQVALYKPAAMEFPYFMCFSGTEFLGLKLSTRKTEQYDVHPANIQPMDKYLPDLDMTDMNVVAQLIADGNLLDHLFHTTNSSEVCNECENMYAL